MKVEIKVPPMGESISEATIGEIINGSGSSVAVDAEVLELETDKVNQMIFASEAGSISLNVNVGDTVKVGQVIGFIETGAVAKDASQPKAPPAATAAPAAAPAAEAKKENAPMENGGVRRGRDSFIADVKSGKETVQKAPLPSAPAQQAPKPAAPAAQAPSVPKSQPTTSGQQGERVETRRKMTRIRQVIAKRLVEAQHTTAMLTTFNEVDMSPVMMMRARYKEQFLKEHNTRIGFMSFFCKACVEALKTFPDINSYIDGDEIIHREYFDLGIAVATDRGLVVPVLRNCEKLSFADIERQIEDFATKAREGTLAVEDLRGGGFTITNGGVYGSLLSTPILNPPQCGILGMHKIEKRPVVVDDQIVIRPMMYLALSYDHRIVDGKEAVSFLVHVKACIEDPARMLIGV